MIFSFLKNLNPMVSLRLTLKVTLYFACKFIGTIYPKHMHNFKGANNLYPLRGYCIYTIRGFITLLWCVFLTYPTPIGAKTKPENKATGISKPLQITLCGIENTRFNLAILDCLFEDPEERLFAQEVEQKLRYWLSGCYAFNVLLPGIFPERISQIDQPPSLLKWQNLCTDSVINLQLKRVRGSVFLKVRVFNLRNQQLLGFVLESEATLSSVNRLVLEAANRIYRAFTGDTIGYFTTKIAYIKNVGGKRSARALCINTLDGLNEKVLYKNPTLTSLALSTKNNMAAFCIREGKTLRLHCLDLFNQKLIKIPFEYNALAPCFSMDGSLLYFSGTDHLTGAFNIYSWDFKTGTLHKITRGNYIDIVSSAHHLNGRDLVFFESNRSGRQNIYVTNLAGNVNELIYADRAKYAVPCIGNKNQLCFVKMFKDFFIMKAQLDLNNPTPSLQNLNTIISSNGKVFDKPKWISDDVLLCLVDESLTLVDKFSHKTLKLNSPFNRIIEFAVGPEF